MSLKTREEAPGSAWTDLADSFVSPRFWLIGIAFVAAYLALNAMTARYQFQSLGITLWSPDDGLTVLMLIEGVKYLPFVLAGAILADVLVTHVHQSFLIIVLAESALILGYLGLAVTLRDVLKFSLSRSDLANLLTMLAAVLVGAILAALLYCGVLFLAGSLPADQFLAALRHFWIGDTVGIIAILAGATAVFTLFSRPRWVWRNDDTLDWTVFIVSSSLVFALLRGENSEYAYHLFYLLFTPVIWIGVRAGYAGVALALLAIQTAFFMIAPHIGVAESDFDQFQILMLVLSVTGLILGATVTERERANLRLREQQGELARVSAQATAGAMGMLLAHELSQPLSTVATYALAARRMLQSGAGAEPVMVTLRKAEAEAQRTRQVVQRIRDLVSVGRLEARPMSLVDAAETIRALSMQGAAARGVEIAVESHRPVPLVRADPIGIEQVLNNIVSNAVDAAAERGDGRGRVVARVSGGDNCAIVQIDDNGRGVSPELAESLFEAYQTSKPRGMGLGLTLSRQIVRQHGGRIWWQPIEPEGTRFVVELKIKGPDGDAE